MLAEHCASSVDICALRLSRLLASGAPDDGTGNLYITDFPQSLGISPQVTEGDDSRARNGCGKIKASKSSDDVIERTDLTLVTIGYEPEFDELSMGGQLLVDGTGNAIGHGLADPSAAAPNGVCVEAWSKAWSTDEQAVDGLDVIWIRHIFPRVKWVPGDTELVEGIQTHEMKGKSTTNSAITDGPFGDWPDTLDGPSAWFYDVETLPAALCGAQALAAVGSQVGSRRYDPAGRRLVDRTDRTPEHLIDGAGASLTGDATMRDESDLEDADRTLRRLARPAPDG